MKRDMELVANLLLAIEELPADDRHGFELRPPHGYDREVVKEHLIIMKDAGLIEGWVVETRGSRDVRVSRMTWAGHEFLDAIRKGDVWDQLASKLKDAPFEVVLEVGKSYAKKKLGLGN